MVPMKSPPPLPKADKHLTPWLLLVIGGGLLLGGLALSIAIYRDLNRPTYYARAADCPIKSLPASATDIHFCQPMPFAPLATSYQFICSEDSYRQWVDETKKNHPELGEIELNDRGVQLRIHPDGSVSQDLIGPHLISAWRHEDEGLYLVYDLKEHRAIRWAHSR